ncbi:hypothetical protein PQO01_18840 [Lentisphaera marina]|nr:hypothetical protein [Lentisphaera marina]MDD7987011.1 hypothetical protein [Lentisphaera marina]
MKQIWKKPSITQISSSYDTLSGANDNQDENPSQGGGNEEPDATKNVVAS